MHQHFLACSRKSLYAELVWVKKTAAMDEVWTCKCLLIPWGSLLTAVVSVGVDVGVTEGGTAAGGVGGLGAGVGALDLNSGGGGGCGVLLCSPPARSSSSLSSLILHSTRQSSLIIIILGTGEEEQQCGFTTGNAHVHETRKILETTTQTQRSAEQRALPLHHLFFSNPAPPPTLP